MFCDPLKNCRPAAGSEADERCGGDPLPCGQGAKNPDGDSRRVFTGIDWETAGKHRVGRTNDDRGGVANDRVWMKIVEAPVIRCLDDARK